MRVGVVETANGRLPGRWSPTAVGDYLSCQLKFWFGRVWGWHEPTSQALLVGTIVHGVLEDVLGHDADARTLELALALLPGRVSDEFAAEPSAQGRVDPKAATELAAMSLRAYFDLEDPAAVAVVPDGLEREVSTSIGEVAFYGKVDRLALDRELLRITDYKTGKASPGHMWDKFRQQYLYVAGLRVLGIPVDEIELLFLGGQARSVRRPVYPAAVDRALDDFRTAVEGSASDFGASAWESSTGPLCRFCAFAPACPDRTPGAPQPGSAASEAILVSLGLERRAPRPGNGAGADEPDLLDLADAVGAGDGA